MDMTFQRTYPHPPEAVWTALTDARAIRQWWLDTDFEPLVGRSFYFQDAPQGGWDGRVTGEVIEVDPGRRLLFSWRGGGVDTTVEYLLSPAGNGATEFTLRHRGFSGVRGLFVGTMLRFGWRGYVRDTLPALARHVADSGISSPFPESPKAERTSGRR